MLKYFSEKEVFNVDRFIGASIGLALLLDLSISFPVTAVETEEIILLLLTVSLLRWGDLSYCSANVASPDHSSQLLKWQQEHRNFL